MRIADELKLFKKLSQGRVKRETLEVEQFQIFICHQLTEIIPIGEKKMARIRTREGRDGAGWDERMDSGTRERGAEDGYPESAELQHIRD